MNQATILEKMQVWLDLAGARFSDGIYGAIASWSLEQKLALIVVLTSLMGMILLHPPRSKNKYGEARIDILMVLAGIVLLGSYTAGVVTQVM